MRTVAVIAVAAALSACGAPDRLPSDPDVLGALGAAEAFAAAVADTGTPTDSASITAVFERMQDRHVYDRPISISWADSDGDGHIDGDQFTFTDVAAVCVAVSDTGPAAVSPGACPGPRAVTLRTSDSVNQPAERSAPAGSGEPGSGTRTEADVRGDQANIATADEFGAYLSQLAILDAADPASIGVLDAAAAGEPNVRLSYRDTDGDGIADGRNVTMEANGSTFCLKIAPTGDVYATFGAC